VANCLLLLTAVPVVMLLTFFRHFFIRFFTFPFGLSCTRRLNNMFSIYLVLIVFAQWVEFF